MLLVKLKWIAGLVLILGVTSSGAFVLARQNGDQGSRVDATSDGKPSAQALANLVDSIDPPRALKDSGIRATVPELEAAKAASLLAEQLKKHPAKPSTTAERLGLYLLDVDQGDATLIADEPDPGRTHCGSTWWSSDGKRILFDATPKNAWKLTHLKTIELRHGRLAFADLGAGNCSSISPDGQRIAVRHEFRRGCRHGAGRLAHECRRLRTTPTRRLRTHQVVARRPPASARQLRRAPCSGQVVSAGRRDRPRTARSRSPVSTYLPSRAGPEMERSSR